MRQKTGDSSISTLTIKSSDIRRTTVPGSNERSVNRVIRRVSMNYSRTADGIDNDQM